MSSTIPTPAPSEADVLDALASDYAPLTEATRSRLAVLLGGAR